MPVSCAYPGCFNIKRPKRTFSSGQTFLTFHRFPTHNPERLILWLLALHLDINTPEHALICKRVCSDHFFEDDFKPSQQGQRRYLKASAVPNTYLQQTEYPSHGNLECPATDSSAELEVQEAVGLEFLANVPQSTPVKQQDSDPGTTTRQFADTQSKLRLLLTSPESVRNRKTPSSSGIYFAQPAIHSNQTPPVYNQPEQMEEQLEESLALDVSLLSIEPQSDKKDLSFQPLSSTSTSTTNSAEEECELHWKQKKWIVNEPNVMELFKRCQECGSVITNTAKATVGSVLRVHWECEKKHKGKWSSCSDVRGMPANNLLVSACTLFTGATYTDIADWATLLNLQIPHKTTYFDIQSSYLTPVIDEEYKEQQKAAMNDLHLQSELCNPVHLSGDGRSDSPGFSAKYNTYSFMDDTTDKIVHFELVQSFPTTRETEFQCDNMQKVTREVGCQTDYFVGKRTVATQLSKRTLANRKNTGSQATVATKSVSVGNTTAKLLPLCSSTPLKRKAVSPDRPPKRSLLEFPSFQESVNSFNMADPDDSTYLPSMSELVDTTSEQAPTKPPQDMVKYLIYEECLLELFKICPTCSRVCKVIKFVKGTFLSVTQKCLHQSCSYTREWKSQPLLGSSPAGNLHLSAAVYYTGSSFIQTNKVLNAMHVRTFSRMTHRNHVHNYILPSVLHKWRSHQSDLLEGLKQSETVSLGGDMRADSPGHCAKYGSYSMMDLSTNKIVDIQLVQSNEVGSSVHMEKEGLIRSLEFLEKSGVKVASLVTDRHTQVQKFVREQKPDIDHFYDVWHLCKALTKKVDAMSKEKDCNTVKMWQKSIKNHLYWSASGSSNGEETVAKWTSLLNHVQNVHVHENPLFPKCLHPPSTDKNKWLKPATKAVYKLEKVLMNKRVLGDVKKLSPLYQTSALEGFHSVILRFAPKNVVFSYLGMLCRLYLAALHFNENSGRTQARTAAGELRFKIKFPKAKRGEHVVSMVKTKYSTEYVTELMDILFNEVIQDPAPFVANMKAVAVPGFLCSTYERPGKSDAIASHVSRFSCPSCEGTALTTPI